MTIIAGLITGIAIGLTTSSPVKSFLKKHKILKSDESSSRPEMTESELNNMSVVTINNQSKQNQSLSSRTRIVQIVLFSLSLMWLFCISYVDSHAKRCGAYGDYYSSASVRSLLDNISNGFEDESEELPSDLSGSIIVYYRYGCEDCKLIHDDLVAFIDEHPTNNIYFVSTRSEIGQPMSESHGITEVPSAVYIFNKETNNMTFARVLLYEPANKDTDKSVFIRDNMEQLIALQKEGI